MVVELVTVYALTAGACGSGVCEFSHAAAAPEFSRVTFLDVGTRGAKNQKCYT
jgi:hypothetical protein